MGSSTTKTDSPQGRAEPTLAKPLAPEDVRAGDFVAILDWMFEAPSFFWCDSSQWQQEDVVRFRFLPHRELLGPLRVESACLPFLLVESPCGDCRTLDLRQVRLARLDRQYGRRAWKKLKPPRGAFRKKKRR